MNWMVILISILYISINAESDENENLLPQSIPELKQYYDFIINLEKRDVINSEIADQEKQLCIKHASKLSGKKELLLDIFTTYKQRQSVLSFTNLIEILAGIILGLAFLLFVNVKIGVLETISQNVWEILLYVISIYLMLLSSSSVLILVGCFIFLIMLGVTISFHSIPYFGTKPDWIGFIVLTIVAIYQQSQAAGYLAVINFLVLLGLQKLTRKLIDMIGFQENEKVIPSATIGSFILLMIGCILHIQQQANFLTIPFTRPLLFLGTFVYFLGMLIITSRFYTEWDKTKYLFWLLQLITFFSGLAAMFFGPMLEIPFIQAIGGTTFFIWLLEKFVKFAPWKGVFTVTGNLLGFGVLLYGFAYFLKSNPEYLIFHSYSSK
jgi:ABC-type multidrug transport system fused ATPase/permease subunit